MEEIEAFIGQRPDYEAAAHVLRKKLSCNGFKMDAAKTRAGHWVPDIIHAAIGDRLLINPTKEEGPW